MMDPQGHMLSFIILSKDRSLERTAKDVPLFVHDVLDGNS